MGERAERADDHTVAAGGTSRSAFERFHFRLGCRRMLRISWPLAILAAAVIAVVAHRPRLVVPVLVVFAVWYAFERTRRRR